MGYIYEGLQVDYILLETISPSMSITESRDGYDIFERISGFSPQSRPTL